MVVIPLNPDELTYAEMRQVLESTNLIKVRINGFINGRTCTNGRKQKINLKDVESVASPTVSL